MQVLRTFLALVGLLGTLVASDDIVPRTLIVKFRPGTVELDRWLAAGRSGTIPALETIVGPHRSRPYLRDGVLRALSQRLQRFNARSSDDPIARLERIAVVEFDRDVDVRLIARKLAAHPAIEYAEPMPERRVFFQPNDSLSAMQYHLTKIRATDAWDSIPGNAPLVLIAIVDTGVDYTHEDLADVIFVNPGETGTDSQGRDKRTNGVDDDGNGFVDDWHGWDIALGDNDPRPGNEHGTHVAGIAAATVNNRIGVAGVCNRARILPVKCATDSPSAPSILNGYEGIAYAAAMGAKVINCSWGGNTSSQAEQEVINTAIAAGSVVVAAAGNSGGEEQLFPAGYTGVLSVAAVGSNDVRAAFSSYHVSVGISAPGVSILSTYPGNTYGYADGTSMASPVVAGAAALVRAKYPTLDPLHVVARLKATADPIDNLTGNRNRAWMGKLGSGRVNAFRAVTEANPKYVELVSATITDDDGDGVFEPGDVVTIVPTFRNLLAPITDARAIIRPVGTGSSIFVFSDSVIVLGMLGSDLTMTAPAPFRLTIPANAPQNYVLTCQVTITDGNTTVGRGTLSFIIMPTFRTLRNGDLVLTVNSTGNLGYNDYPTNLQGEGFRYKSSPSVLFEAGLMIGSSADKLSDVVRNETGNAQNTDFQIGIPTVLRTVASTNTEEVVTTFADQGLSAQANVQVEHHTYVFDEDNKRDFALCVYRITNRNPEPVESMYCGIYADWDVGQSGQNDVAIWSDEDSFYYVYNTRDTSLPYVGMQLVSDHQPNSFMMDNDGNTSDNPGVYDGYTKAEKWRTISSGIGRARSNVTDASAVIAAGPFRMDAGATEQVVFSIFAGRSLADLRSAAERARQTAQQLLGVTPTEPRTTSLSVRVTPNPATGDNLTIEYTLPDSGTMSLEITDALGRTVATVLASGVHPPHGRLDVQLDGRWSQGTYFAVVRGARQSVAAPFVIVR
ncbi:MAG: S8 family serine peptidase [Chlorobi bacterium]|nr:S8 family serine peptidase [Chlorobiota bacterium]